MGANQSSSEVRSVLMVNSNPLGVIDVSNEVAQRINNRTNRGKQRTNATREQNESHQEKGPEILVDAETKPAPQQQHVPVQTPPKRVYTDPKPSARHIAPQAPINATLTAMDVRRQKEIELQHNDELWRSRMANLEQTLSKTNAIMEQEYSVAVENVRKRFMNAAPVHQLPPCQNFKAQLIACYRAYPHETLKCTEEVSAFRNCVAMNRVQKLDTKATPATAA